MKQKRGVLYLVMTTMLIGAIFTTSYYRADAGTVATSLPIQTEEKVITTNGSATISVKPDVAYINIGVISENKSLEKAQTEVNTNMNKIMDSLKKLGIAERDIQTSRYNVNPNYQWNKESGLSEKIGYIVNNTVEVTIRDLNKVGKAIDAATAVGGNEINGIRFGITNEEEFYNKALETAVTNAKSKANAIGKGLNAKNVIPLRVVENGYSSPIMFTEMYTKNTMTDTAATSISPGSLEISASVTVDFNFQ